MDNSASNVVGKVVQAGSIHGGVHFHGDVRAAEVPRQVPSGPRVFVNREAELAALDGLGGGIAVLSGAPGSGKSATAYRWADRVGDRFPGGQLYIDFDDFRHRAGAAVGDALTTCLHGLGVDSRFLPSTLGQLTNLFRTRTADRPVLVVLDGVAFASQVTPLIPKAPGSVVLVTSYDRLDELVLHDAAQLPLDPLDDAHSVRLLESLAPAGLVAAEPEAAARLVGLCGGLPLALRVAAARLARRPRIAELVDELADEAAGLGGFVVGGKPVLTALFAIAYENLPADAARAYRSLGALPVREIPAGLAAEFASREVLDALVAASLLTERRSGRHEFHSLTRRHARDLVDAAEREDATRRAVRYYLARAVFADRTSMGSRKTVADHTEVLAGRDNPFTTGGEALDWFETERANLLLVHRAAAEFGWDTWVWHLAETLTAFYLNRRYLLDWISSTELGVAAAHGVPAAEARLRTLVSRAFTDLGELDRAKEELDAAEPLALSTGDLVLQASVWEFRGRVLDHHDHDAAAAAYRTSQELNELGGSARGYALATYFLGCSQDAAGHADAVATLTRARDLLRAEDDHRMAARASASLGLAFAHTGGKTEAVAALTEAVATLAALGLVHYEAQAREHLAEVLDDPVAAREQWRLAHSTYAKYGSPRAEELVAEGRVDG